MTVHDRVETIDLRDRIEGGASIEFLRLEASGVYSTPFALVRYAVDGVEPDRGLRIDLDKMAFLDHFEDQAKQRVIEQAAPKIVELVGERLERERRRTWEFEKRGD